MAELNRVQHESLGSGFSDEVFFGGFVPVLGGAFMPAKAEQINGTHYAAMINLVASLVRLTEAVSRLRVYRDSDDGDDEFSVSAATMTLPAGLECSFGGAVAMGPLAAGVNRIWAVVGPTITIEFGTDWPEHHRPVVRLGTIEQPASGPWLPQHFTPSVSAQALTMPRGTPRIIRRDITIDDDGAIDLESVPAGALVLKAMVCVHEAFDGSAPTITVGDAGDAERLVESADVTLGTPGVYEVTPGYRYAALTELTAALDIDSSTEGQASIILAVV